jgi:hypothetical protein
VAMIDPWDGAGNDYWRNFLEMHSRAVQCRRICEERDHALQKLKAQTAAVHAERTRRQVRCWLLLLLVGGTMGPTSYL